MQIALDFRYHNMKDGIGESPSSRPGLAADFRASAGVDTAGAPR